MLFNFKLVGISSKNVQILIGFDPIKGINPAFLAFEKQNRYGTLYFYKDERVSPKYRSSIRPHILAKHFKKYPSLSAGIIFYHDCNIIFRKRLNESFLEKEETCYVSDASTYMNLKYINKFDGALQKMVATVGIDELLITQNDAHTGGAQYVLKSISVPFWEKLGSDSEVLLA